MAAPQKIFSIYLDVRRELKTVFATISGGKITVESFDHAMMVSVLKQQVEETDELIDGEPLMEDAGDVFGVEDEPIEITDETLFGGDEDEAEDMVSVDDAEVIQDGDTGELTNEDVLLSLIQRVDAKKFQFAINIPATLLSVFHLRDNYEELKPKERNKEIRDTVRERLDKDIPSDHIAHIMASEGGGAISFSYEGNIPLLTAIDGIVPHLDSAPKFTLAVPDEISLQNIIRLNENPGEEDYIAIIDMEETSTRIIISKGGNIVHIPPPVQAGTETPEVMNTIYSKILYEQDMGDMPDFQKIILTGESKDVNAKEFLDEKFGDAEVEYLTIRTDKIEIPEELIEDLPEYAVPLGMVLHALIPKDDSILPVNMLPDYVKVRQKTLKLDWHGIIILAAIFALPFVFNWQNNKKATQKSEMTQRLNYLHGSIVDLEWAEPLLDSIATKMALADENMTLVDSLSKGTLRFSVTLNTINEAVRKVNSIWLTEMNTRANGIDISGFSLYRNRIHRLASQFIGATIQSVTPAQIRDKPVYRFQMLLVKIVEDDSLFNPVVVIPEPEPELIVEEVVELPVVELVETPVETLEVVEIVEDTVVIPVVELVETPVETLEVVEIVEDTVLIPVVELMDIPPGMILPDTLYGVEFTVELPPDYEKELDSLFADTQLQDTIIVSEEEAEPAPIIDTYIDSTPDIYESASLIYISKQNLPLEYSKAFGYYISSDYVPALEIFIAIADARIEDSLTDNAQYWVGECLLALELPDQAIVALERLFKLYPNSNKLEPGQLLLGKAYAEVGRKDEALKLLNMMLNENPNGEFSDKARYMLNSIIKQG
ncbi:MAG: tetratricopeptide repeat protein [Candidatus Marinimicrobia bacterium]|nr:tetratricopeptide repeat protein [Candidatus Neomarinimicrobiota bacterium]